MPEGRMFSKLKRLNYRHFLPDAIIVAGSLYASLFLRVGLEESKPHLHVLNSYLLLFVGLRLATLFALGVYDIIWRFISLRDAALLFRALVLSSIIEIAASYILDLGRLPRAIFFIDTALAMSLLTGLRLSRRLVYEWNLGKKIEVSGVRTLIFGAGNQGRSLAHRLKSESQSGMKVIGFLDDDREKVGRVIAGVKVLGTHQDLALVLKNFAVQELVVSIRKPGADLLRSVVKTCRLTKVNCRLISDVAETNAPAKTKQAFRNIELSDLLNRVKRELATPAIRDLIFGRKVLITGAGGSIGSELARQIVAFEPSLVLLLDHSEYNLYQIDQELRDLAPAASLVLPILADVKDFHALSQLFKEYRPELVFHAAAYKHVHLVENNPYSSILNNIQGTAHLLDLCEKTDVGTFVLISTDKAVNPAGVMGATKRICELLTHDAGKRLGHRYCSVRFGNVLGSSGSLIPRLKSQIENGDALTITHRDMTRYFMLIPEAVSLVLRAATIAKSGDIALLKMGEPVKILEIAKSLVALMGKTQNEVPIVFTGLRPGEKLFEELYLHGNEIDTEDPDILIVPKGDHAELGTAALRNAVDEIIAYAKEGNPESLFRMGQIVKSNYKLPLSAQNARDASFPEEGEVEKWLRRDRGEASDADLPRLH
jgi:FlaA1/EpsC-like NDP-sugar epimerase